MLLEVKAIYARNETTVEDDYMSALDVLAGIGLICGGSINPAPGFSEFIAFPHTECHDKECPVPVLPKITKAVIKDAVCIIEDAGFVVEKVALEDDEGDE